MPLIFGDKDSIKLYKSKISRKRPEYYRYLSSCCSAYVEAYCDWEEKKESEDYEVVASPYYGLFSSTKKLTNSKIIRKAVTLIEKCSQCKNSCLTVKVPVY